MLASASRAFMLQSTAPCWQIKHEMSARRECVSHDNFYLSLRKLDNHVIGDNDARWRSLADIDRFLNVSIIFVASTMI
jgi:hypothetical protein